MPGTVYLWAAIDRSRPTADVPLSEPHCCWTTEADVGTRSSGAAPLLAKFPPESLILDNGLKRDISHVDVWPKVTE